MRYAVAVALVALAACGSQNAATGTRPVRSTAACTDAGAYETLRYFVCATTSGMHYGKLAVRENGVVRALRVPFPETIGRWRWAAISPDGRWLLAQLSAGCGTTKTFFVSAESGRPRAVVAVRGEAVDSEAFGWTSDGRAIVWFPADVGCLSGLGREGVYLVRPGGRPVFWRVRAPKRSLTPRDVG
jgi:hypothetical protein